MTAWHVTACRYGELAKGSALSAFEVMHVLGSDHVDTAAIFIVIIVCYH